MSTARQPGMNQPEEERSVIDVIADMRSGALSGKALDPETRRSCVLYLLGEGLNQAEIAKLIGVSPKTIQRDVEAIREANELERDLRFAGKIGGELVISTRAAIARLLRIARDKSNPPAVRIDAERAAFEMRIKEIACLQSLEFLPSAAHRIEASHTLSLEPPGIDALEVEIEQLKPLADDETAKDLDRLKGSTDRLLQAGEGQAPSINDTDDGKSKEDPDGRQNED